MRMVSVKGRAMNAVSVMVGSGTDGSLPLIAIIMSAVAAIFDDGDTQGRLSSQ